MDSLSLVECVDIILIEIIVAKMMRGMNARVTKLSFQLNTKPNIIEANNVETA